MPRTKLEGSSLQEKLKEIPQWKEGKADSGTEAILRKFEFKDFKEAWGFMSKIADEAEKVDHHPDWKNVYNRVEIALNTHDVKGISQSDIDLAKKIDSFYSKDN
eukprot:TRINITY_DN3842_c0_g1_i1.p1 TRINITY_DN3842_c0_g1~~TRINITY_DN3842_c0_g1_i1.p1  ORF type:complete len:104 (+),score=36.70 TRINITY_DN3842_c0_g1_i1:85-396(+)